MTFHAEQLNRSNLHNQITDKRKIMIWLLKRMDKEIQQRRYVLLFKQYKAFNLLINTANTATSNLMNHEI